MLFGFLANAQLVVPVVTNEPSNITRSSFLVRVVDTNASETGIEIEYSGGGSTAVISSGPSSVINQPITNLMPKTTYSVRARAIQGITLGPWSDPIFVTTKVDIPVAPVVSSSYNCPTNVGIGWSVSARPEDINEFIVQRTYDLGSWVTIANPFPTERFVNDGDAQPGRSIYYRVIAKNESGTSISQPLLVSTIPFTGPKPHTGVFSDKNAKGYTFLTIRWENPADDACGSDTRATNILVAKLANETDYKFIAEVYPNDTKARIEGLSPKDIVDYRVYSLSDRGLISQWVGGRDTTWGPPFPPSDLIIVAFKDALNNSVLSVSWKDNSPDEDYFTVEYSTDSVNFKLLGQIKFDNNMLNHINIEEGTKYYYRVKAGSNSDGESAYTPISFGVMYPFSEAPKAPYALSASLVGSTVALKWFDDSSKEENFILERSENNNTTYNPISTLPKNSTTFVDANVTAGKTYFYKLKAVNPIGESAYSNEVEIKTAATQGLINELSIGIYPNPSSDFLKITIPNEIVGESGKLKLLDQNNKTVFEKSFTELKSEFSIPLQNLTPGIYNLNISSDSFSDTKKVVKQ